MKQWIVSVVHGDGKRLQQTEQHFFPALTLAYMEKLRQEVQRPRLLGAKQNDQVPTEITLISAK